MACKYNASSRPGVPSPQTGKYLPGMRCYMGWSVYDVQDDCSEASSAGFLPHWNIIRAVDFLTDHAQDIIGNDRQFKKQLICIKLVGRKTFHIRVMLQLAMELLGLPMGMV